MKPVITTFYTSKYLDHVTELVASARSLGLDVEITHYTHLSTWSQAVCFKPQHILRCLKELPPDEGDREPEEEFRVLESDCGEFPRHFCF